MSGFSFLLPMVGAGIAIAAMQLLQRFALRGQPSPLPFLVLSQSVLLFVMGTVYLYQWGVTLPPRIMPGYWQAVLMGTLAITLGEFPGPRGIFGIALMTVGSWILLSPKTVKHWSGYFIPFYQLAVITRYSTLTDAEKQRTKVMWLTLGSAILATVGLLSSGLYVRRGGDTQGWWLAAMVLWFAITAAYALQYVFLRKPSAANEGKTGVKFFAAAVVSGLLILAVTWFEYPLYFETYVAYVGTLKRLSILFVVVLGYLFFKEEDIKKRFVAALFIVAGALFIGSEDIPGRLTDKIEFLGF